MNTNKWAGIHHIKERKECPNWKKRWVAQLKCLDKKYHIYCYTKEEALKIRKELEIKYFKEYRYGANN